MATEVIAASCGVSPCQETLRTALAIGAVLRLNEPRDVTLPNILKARKKALEVVEPADLGVDVAARVRTLEVSEPPQRGAGLEVADVAALVERRQNEAKVIRP